MGTIDSREYTLSIDSFNQPKAYKDKEAAALLILRLLLLEPGTNNSHPEMGVGIVSKYRFSDENAIDDLKLKIKDQIYTYLPSLALQTVDLVLKNKILYISIQTDDDSYVYQLDTDAKILTLESLKNG